LKPLQSGIFRQRVTLQDLVETVDSYGQAIQTWTDVSTFWAEVRPISGREAVNIRQVYATATTLIRHRYLGPALDPSPKQRYRLEKDGRIFNILDPTNIEERNRSIESVCEERVD
jgi:SPP1 family predicted phage head-tail adaptor